MVWSNKLSRLGIFLQPYHVALSGVGKEKLLVRVYLWSVLPVKTGHCQPGQRWRSLIWHQQGQLCSTWLEQWLEQWLDGVLLLQKHCKCLLNKAALICCPEGRELVFAIEGEAIAVGWSLEKCHMFIVRCPERIIVATDHQPLFIILWWQRPQ